MFCLQLYIGILMVYNRINRLTQKKGSDSMQISFETVLERDMDLLIIEEFISDPCFASIFMNAAGITDEYTVEHIIHSKMDAQYGESDIVVVLKICDRLHALHIEDKIDAIAMPNQSGRYHLRAKKDIANGEYQTYSVLITAPEKYLKNNVEAQKYAHKVSFEQLQGYFSEKSDMRSKYKHALISKAINAGKNGYQWEANPHVVRFCTAMYAYQAEHFPGMPKGTIAWWPTYKTIHKDISINFKANKGHCDLSFPGPVDELYKKYKDRVHGRMTIEQTGKSSAIRIAVKPIYFEKAFEEHMPEVHAALQAIKELIDFANEL